MEPIRHAPSGADGLDTYAGTARGKHAGLGCSPRRKPRRGPRFASNPGVEGSMQKYKRNLLSAALASAIAMSVQPARAQGADDPATATDESTETVAERRA